MPPGAGVGIGNCRRPRGRGGAIRDLRARGVRPVAAQLQRDMKVAPLTVSIAARSR